MHAAPRFGVEKHEKTHGAAAHSSGPQAAPVHWDCMTHVAIVCKPQKEELARILPELIAWLRQHGYEPLVDREGGEFCRDAPVIDRAEMPRCSPVLVIVLGGDGTLLSVARIFAATGTPYPQREPWIPRLSYRDSPGRSLHDP